MSLEKIALDLIKKIQRYDIKLINFFLNINFFKFLFVGGISTIVNYLVFFILFSNDLLNYILASSSGYFSGVIFGFVLNKFWSFNHKKSKNYLREIILYNLVYLISFVIGISFLYVLVEYLGINPLIANVLTIGVTTITNFVGLKKIVFLGDAK